MCFPLTDVPQTVTAKMLSICFIFEFFCFFLKLNEKLLFFCVCKILDVAADDAKYITEHQIHSGINIHTHELL